MKRIGSNRRQESSMIWYGCLLVWDVVNRVGISKKCPRNMFGRWKMQGRKRVRGGKKAIAL